MTVFGIDLGTTQSCMAMIDETGRPVILRSALGEETTPSVVYFESPSSVIVGSAARNSALLYPDQVAQLVKRDMGKDVVYRYNGEEHRPETVSALILRELARAAAEQTGCPVRDVVLTVPAYFGIAEREATRRAGQIAGLTVLDVLAEPVAAALSYRAVTGPSAGVRHLLVYDLGGGTFDVSVIRVDGDDITVICTDGLDNVGGADWDQVIADYLLSQFTAEHLALDPRHDPQFMQDLLISAEQLKKDLSKVQGRRRNLRFAGAVTRGELNRAKLEELTASLLDRTITVTERAIVAARDCGVAGFDDVLLVGGMSRMPAVTRLLRERLGLEARQHEPDLAVAKGAALFALIQAAQQVTGMQAGTGEAIPAETRERLAAASGLTVPEAETMASRRVTTVIPRAFGVMSLDGRDPLAQTDPLRARKMIVHLLPANTPLPADTGPFTFHTAIDNQRLVGVEVWEQDSEVASELLENNRKVGEGMLTNLPARLPPGTPLEVTFLMSETGALRVHAVEPQSGRAVRFELRIGGLDGPAMDKARTAVARYNVSG
jgi:molecular chaperone DnaK (HSP70)